MLTSSPFYAHNTDPLTKRKPTNVTLQARSYLLGRWSHGGKEIRESSGTEDKTQAQEWYDRRKAELWRVARIGEKPVESWDEAVLQWVEEHAQFKKSYEDDRLRLRWLTDKLTGRAISSITTDDMLKMRKELMKTRAASTANRFMAVISGVLTYAFKKGKLPGVPAIPYLEENNERFLYLTHEQADALIRELPPHLSAMARFALATGLRRSNVTGMTWQNVDMNRKIAWVWAADAKGKRNIPVPLSVDALEVLAELRGAHPKFVFTYEGEPVTRTTTAAWKKAIARAGIDPEFTFHCLRHTWASWHVMSGTPLDVLQKLGAWRSFDMVLRYSHLAPDYIANFADNSARNRTPVAQSKISNIADYAKKP